jgi:hypothetical protein
MADLRFGRRRVRVGKRGLQYGKTSRVEDIFGRQKGLSITKQEKPNWTIIIAIGALVAAILIAIVIIATTTSKNKSRKQSGETNI